MEFIDLKTQQMRIKESLDHRIQSILANGQYIMGPEIAELEGVLANYAGSQFCSTNSSGTDALVLALMALEIGPGDEVITSPFTFFASAEAISLLGATPVFADIDPETYNISPKAIEEKITKKTKAIMPVSLYGQCADLKSINALADNYSLAVIEDAAQSFGATIDGQKSCALSTIGCTSFFPSKPLGGYGDSGACFTNDEEILHKLNSLRAHGQAQRYHHVRLGMNGRMDTLQAAILLAKMEIFPEEVELRGRIGARYNDFLQGKFRTQKIMPGHTSVFAQYTIEVDDRDSFQKKLASKDIPTAVHYPKPLHLQPVYLGELPYKEGDFPHAERAALRVVSLPMHPYLDQEQQDRIIEVVLN